MRDKIAKPSPRLEQGKVAIWFTTDLENVPGLDKVKEELKAAGVRVNEPLRSGDSLVTFGKGVDQLWKVRLTNGANASGVAGSSTSR